MMPVCRNFWRSAAGLCAVFACALSSGAQSLVIDRFDYSNNAAAQTAWVACAGSPAVEMVDSGGWGAERAMKLTCNFSNQPSRCYWDRSVALDLSGFRCLALEIYVQDPGALSAITLYFHSGSGWYAQSATVAHAGWQTFIFPICDFSRQDTPAGWNQVDAIRLSPWKKAGRDNYLAVRELRAYVPEVLIVRDTEGADQYTVEQVVARHVDWLSHYDILPCIVPNSVVQSNYLDGCKMVILPYNESMPEPLLQELERFVGAGGKVMAYSTLPERLQTLLGFRISGWAQGDFAAYTLSDAEIHELPPRVTQASWNIVFAEPASGLDARVIATWQDSNGVTNGHPAWLASANGLFMSHILLGDDAENKQFMLLALVAHYIPGVWSNAAAAGIDRIGQVACYAAYAGAVSDIRARAEPTLRVALVEQKLAAAELSRGEAQAAFAEGRYPQAVQSALTARAALVSAYALSQEPVVPEFRAVWESSGTGPYPGNWPAAIGAIVSNGFNAVFPNMLSGGLAHFNSSILPHSDVYNAYGDQITACVAAAHARGVKVHVWKANWNLAGAQQSFIDSMRAAQRTQVSASGQPLDWLCPSHPDNLAMERDSMLEIVQNYDVDGIHFDYIRYLNLDYCFCEGCHSRFVEQTGASVTNWPADALAAGPLRDAFLNWRREQITKLVQSVHSAVKLIKPGVAVSAAVFPDYAYAYDGVGQDWVHWMDLGIVDFLCPMDYTDDNDNFRRLVAQQMNYAAGRFPIYPGIDALLLSPDTVICQAAAARELGAGGFIVFNFDRQLALTCLPALAEGATADDEADLDRDRLADAWEARYFGQTRLADAFSDSDGDRQSDRAEYVAGSDPTNATDVLKLDLRVQGSGLELAFMGRAAQGPGYNRIARHYRLEATTNLLPGQIWMPVAGCSDRVVDAGVEEIACPVPAGADQRMFFRVRVWLQQTP